MYDNNQNEPPVNHIPTAVVLVTMLIGAVELVLQAGEHGLIGGPNAVGWRVGAINDYGVYGALLRSMFETRTFPATDLFRLVAYPFIHAGFSHVVFGLVLVLAIGKMIAEAFSQTAFVLIFFLSAIVGALAYGFLVDSRVPLIGSYPSAYGLIGAMTYMLWVRARVEGTNPLRAFMLIGALLGIQMYFGLLYGSGYVWVANFAGFLTGFSLSFFLAPGGMARMRLWLERIRRRN